MIQRHTVVHSLTYQQLNTMPIITNHTPVSPSVIPLERRLEMTARRLSMMAQQQYDKLCQMQREGINFMWHNPDLTPQQVADAAGTDAVAYLAAHSTLTAMIVGIATANGVTPNISLPTAEWTENPDGTITIIEPEAPEEAP